MRRTALFACAIGLTLGPASAAAADPSTMVTDPSTIATVGGERVEISMHGDRIPRGSDFELRGRVRAMPRLAAASLAPSWCGTERRTDDTANASQSGARVKVVYAYAQDRPNRFNDYKHLIQNDIRTMSDWVAGSARGVRTIRFDTGTSCGPEYVDIASVQLPRIRSVYVGSASRSSLVLTDVKGALSEMTGTRNFLIYADGLYADDYVLGTGQLPEDDSPGDLNASNHGGAAAMVWGDGESDFIPERLTTALHEVSHTLGAVQDTAPHSTIAGHCYDVQDVMCYADGGPHGTPDYLVDACTGTVPILPYECGFDDYFNASPNPGTYLDTHWNLYDSRFMCDVGSCVAEAGTAPPPAPTPTPFPTNPTPDASPTTPDPVPDPGDPAGEQASAWLDQFVLGGAAALKKVGLRGLAQGKALVIAGQPPAGHSVQVDLMIGAGAVAGGTLDAGGKTRLKLPRVHRRALVSRTKVRFTLQGVIRASAGYGAPTVKRVAVTLKAPAKKKRRRR
ncbi:MAG TPA: hypothetical protein VF712_13395 [Thermoleophilaceae bacterium]